MGKNKNQYEFDPSFYRLASEITKVLEKNKDGSIQKDQVEDLLDVEKKFKEIILKYRQSNEIYKKFLQKIRVTNKNILSARPYFRESAVTFSKQLTPHLKTGNIEEIKKFNINYQFIKFIKESWLGPFPKKAEQLYNRVHLARNKLIENNLPLAINRAKLFYRKTPKSHLTLIDFINICAMGLAAGVDKYVGKYSPVFRSVCIGRMVGNMIDSYSETMIHFYPSDRRVLYKANTIRGRQGITDIAELSVAINQAFKQDKIDGKSVPKEDITPSDLGALMSAASTTSADATVNEEGQGVYQFTPDSAPSMDEVYIQKESISRMMFYTKELPVIYRKILKLKGVKI